MIILKVSIVYADLSLDQVVIHWDKKLLQWWYTAYRIGYQIFPHWVKAFLMIVIIIRQLSKGLQIWGLFVLKPLHITMDGLP